MCGIVGFCGENAMALAGRLDAATDALAHRGPDDRGTWVAPDLLLGHRRLAIIDLTSAGHQPMTDPATGAVIVFNGEIYNFLELGRELESLGERFRTRSDTEVLLRALVRWGVDALPRLNGMFAFAYWEPTMGRLLLARDRFGVKPLYLARGGGITFGSEPKALLELRPELRRVDERTLYEFLALGRLYTREASFYAGIELLPAAHWAEYLPATDTLRTSRYWDYPEVEDPARTDEGAIEEFSALLDDAVRLRLRSDVQVGMTLSGGLDSSAILAAAMRERSEPVVCFTSVYGGSDRGEAAWASTAAAPYGIVPVEVTAPRSDWLATMERISWHMDGPGYSPAVFPLWAIMAQARVSGVPVLLEGQGADEELAGYPSYAALDMLSAARRALLSPREVPQAWREWRSLSGTFTPFWLGAYVLRESVPALLPRYRRWLGAERVLAPQMREYGRGISPVLAALAPAGRDPVTQRLVSDHRRDILPGLLHYGDAISMAHGVESRQPFLDVRLVEWLFRAPLSLKLRDGQTKWVLRRYLERRQQGAIAARVSKLGYPTKVEQWLGEDDARLARDLLLAPDGQLRQYCDVGALSNWLAGAARESAWSSRSNHVYRLVSAELWLRACMRTVPPARGMVA